MTADLHHCQKKQLLQLHVLQEGSPGDHATDMAYKAIAEYGLNQTIGPVSIATLSSGGIDESGGAVPWGRDQVLQFSNFLLLPIQFLARTGLGMAKA